MRELGNWLIAHLRVGSVLTTRSGTSYRVIEPVVQVASNGSVAPALVLEKTGHGCSPQSVFMSVGILTNLMRAGGRHKPGPGLAIDWPRVNRRAMTKETIFLRRRQA